jgi:hypothetical protein
MHCCPVAHAEPVAPQTHAPAALHVSATAALQAMHAAPALPHVEVVFERHWFPSQQPPGQLAALHSHTPPSQCWPAAQAAPEPQRHWPPPQVSAVAAGHAKHTPPSEPQAAALG